MNTFTTRDYAHMAIVTAIYIVLTITPPFNAIAYGAYQFRVSEMLNFLAFYHRKYLFAVTLGCMISNLYSFGMIDVFVGGGSTLLFVYLGTILFKQYQKDYLFNGLINKAFFFFSFFFSASMITVAVELKIVAGLPLLLTWLTTAVCELASLLVGAVLVDKLSRHVDFTK